MLRHRKCNKILCAQIVFFINVNKNVSTHHTLQTYTIYFVFMEHKPYQQNILYLLYRQNIL